MKTIHSPYFLRIILRQVFFPCQEFGVNLPSRQFCKWALETLVGIDIFPEKVCKNNNCKMDIEAALKAAAEVGAFSPRLGEVLAFLLKDAAEAKAEFR